MFTYRNLTTVCCAAVLAFGLAACGSDDDNRSMMGEPAMDLAWDMLDGETIEPGTYAISSAPAGLLAAAENIEMPAGGYVPGSMIELGGYVLTCTGTVNCSVAVDDDGNVMTTGTIMVAAATMDPMDPMMADVMLPADLPETLPPAEGEIMIAAGMYAESGGVMFSCAADGEDCVVTVDADGMATSTGGTVTATLTMAAQEMVDEEKMMAERMMTERAIGQSAALANGGADAQTASDTAFDRGDVMISHAKGKDVSARVTGYTAAEEQPGMLGNFAGVALTNTSSATATQHVMAYTDIAEPKLAQFYDYDGSSETLNVYQGNAYQGRVFDMDNTTATDLDGDAAAPVHLRIYDENEAATVAPGPATNGALFSAANLDPAIFPQKADTSSGGDTVKRFEANHDSNTDTDGLETVSRIYS